jgi:hypothetical protein
MMMIVLLPVMGKGNTEPSSFARLRQADNEMKLKERHC